jgi:hypothetical protein
MVMALLLNRLEDIAANCIDDITSGKILLLIKDLSESAGIVSYLASPLAIREHYKLETGKNIKEQMEIEGGIILHFYYDGYVDWLEEQLVKLGAR